MGRFEHLEMGDWRPVRPDGEPVDAGVIDENYYIEKAQQAFADETYERALSLFSRALQYNANLEVAWLGQLRCLIELQELQEAIIWSDRALERFPKSGEILAARAVAEARMGRSNAAIQYSDAAFREAGSSTPFIWIARGEVLIGVNMMNAKACFSKAVELAPQNAMVRAWIARSYLISRCYPQALEHLRVAVQVDPNDFTSWYWVGKCCDALGETQEAKRAYMRALSAQPGFSKARDAFTELEKRGPMSRLLSGIKRCFGRVTG